MKFKKLSAIILSAFCLISITGCAEQTNTSTEVISDVTTVESSSTDVTTDFGIGINDSVEDSDVVTSELVVSDYTVEEFDLDSIPAFTDTPYVVINNNIPYFTDDEIVSESFEYYSDLDSLGRCGVAVACIGQDIMPTEERGAIGSVKPSGWQTVKYDCVDGKYLYNRCHLIGYQLSGENANEKNLITGTRYLNVDGMLPFENMVADYVKETDNHVMYRVTPIFSGSNLVASGVLMEGYSVEDSGDGILFNVYCYNNQPGIKIDYSCGDSVEFDDSVDSNSTVTTTQEVVIEQDVDSADNSVSDSTYIINTNTGKFHEPSCSSVDSMNDSNKKEYTGSREDLLSQGYEPCKRCNP